MKESGIQDRAIVACTDIAHLYPYIVGKFYTLDARLITIGITGVPDVFGFRHTDGKMIFLEFKTIDGRLRPDQIKFRDNVAKNNPAIIYGVPRSIAAAREIILEGRNDARL